jgi:hypothetical protein
MKKFLLLLALILTQFIANSQSLENAVASPGRTRNEAGEQIRQEAVAIFDERAYSKRMSFEKQNVHKQPHFYLIFSTKQPQ